MRVNEKKLSKAPRSSACLRAGLVSRSVLSTLHGLFGAELYRLRISRGLTQRAAANLAGLTRGYYSQLENSKRIPPPLTTLERICVALNLTIAETERLKQTARSERSAKLHLPTELPERVVIVIQLLTLKAHELSSARLRKLENLLTEDSVM